MSTTVGKRSLPFLPQTTFPNRVIRHLDRGPITLICFPWLLPYFPPLIQTHCDVYLTQFVSIQKSPPNRCHYRRSFIVFALLVVSYRRAGPPVGENNIPSGKFIIVVSDPRTTAVPIDARNDCENFEQLRRGEREIFERKYGFR